MFKNRARAGTFAGVWAQWSPQQSLVDQRNGATASNRPPVNAPMSAHPSAGQPDRRRQAHTAAARASNASPQAGGLRLQPAAGEHLGVQAVDVVDAQAAQPRQVPWVAGPAQPAAHGGRRAAQLGGDGPVPTPGGLGYQRGTDDSVASASRGWPPGRRAAMMSTVLPGSTPETHRSRRARGNAAGTRALIDTRQMARWYVGALHGIQAGRGIPRPLRPALDVGARHHARHPMHTSGCWAEWVERWHATSILTPKVRGIVRATMAKVGRRMADQRPGIVEPSQWTRQTCASWVAAIDRMTIGDYVQRKHGLSECHGQPIAPRTKAVYLTATRNLLPRLPGVGVASCASAYRTRRRPSAADDPRMSGAWPYACR
jgi:hypothetical protein